MPCPNRTRRPARWRAPSSRRCGRKPRARIHHGAWTKPSSTRSRSAGGRHHSCPGWPPTSWPPRSCWGARSLRQDLPRPMTASPSYWCAYPLRIGWSRCGASWDPASSDWDGGFGMARAGAGPGTTAAGGRSSCSRVTGPRASIGPTAATKPSARPWSPASRSSASRRIPPGRCRATSCAPSTGRFSSLRSTPRF